MRTLAALLSLLVPVLAQAQSGREVRQDARELRQDRRQLRDDVRDARRFEALLAAFDSARASGQMAALVDIDRQIEDAIASEVRESDREVAQKAAEAARSQAEVRRDRHELAHDVGDGRPGRAAHDLRDDRRDARDDRRDLAVEAGTRNRLLALQGEYRGLAGRMDPWGLDRRRAILVELNGLARAEIRQDIRETREDRREVREDLRERREERREHR